MITRSPGPVRLEDFGDYLTPAEVAELLRCSRYHIYNLCNRGEMPHQRLGQLIRIPRKGLEEWLKGEEKQQQGWKPQVVRAR